MKIHRAGFSRTVLVALTLLPVLALAACGHDGAATEATKAAATTAAATTTAPGATPAKAPVEGEIVVFAASSLTEAFKEMGKAFQTGNPNAKVAFNFAASSALAAQINEGQPADVFASADGAQMKVVSEKGATEEQRNFVTNLPVVVVPKNSTAVASFADLAKQGVKVVVAAKEVPIGKYSRDIFAAATGARGVSTDFGDKVLANVKSEEANVRGVLTKVQLGEADAGIVYTTDIGTAANDVKALEIPTKYNVIAEYPIAALKTSKKIETARAFVAYVLSPAGQAILAKYGFGKPNP